MFRFKDSMVELHLIQAEALKHNLLKNISMFIVCARSEPVLYSIKKTEV